MLKIRIPVPDVVIFVVGYVLIMLSGQIQRIGPTDVQSEAWADQWNFAKDALGIVGMLFCVIALAEMLKGTGRAWSERLLGPRTSRAKNLLWTILLSLGAVLLASHHGQAPWPIGKILLGIVFVVAISAAICFAIRRPPDMASRIDVK